MYVNTPLCSEFVTFLFLAQSRTHILLAVALCLRPIIHYRMSPTRKCDCINAWIWFMRHVSTLSTISYEVRSINHFILWSPCNGQAGYSMCDGLLVAMLVSGKNCNVQFFCLFGVPMPLDKFSMWSKGQRFANIIEHLRMQPPWLLLWVHLICGMCVTNKALSC